jgi:hypothetical protein
MSSPIKPTVMLGERSVVGVRRHRFRRWLDQAGLYVSVLIPVSPSILTHLVLTVPIVVWIMIGYFEGLPVALEERRWWTAPRSGKRSDTLRCRWRGRGSW